MVKPNTRVLFVPLDERPCNYEFPYLLAQGTDLQMERPPLEWMGQKKIPGDTTRLWAWLEERAAAADGAIIAMDTLLYGGIVPSRLHEMTSEQVRGRVNRLRRLKQLYPQLTLYAFQLIMRCPQYSLADEEPDYYADWGREIFRKGFIEHRQELGIATSEEVLELTDINQRLPVEVLGDYLGRRRVNLEANEAALELVAEGVIDFMVIPQDDSAPYGYTAKDQQQLRSRISELALDLNVYMYPGADEVGCTLLARWVNQANQAVPLIYPRLSALQGAFVVPLFEDRYFYETLKYQIMAAGGLIASSAAEADLILLANTPGDTMAEASSQQRAMAGYDVHRNVVELVEYGAHMLHYEGKNIAFADVGYANGADLKLLRLLKQKGLLFKLAGYAGWNTSSNTLGTVIAQSTLYTHYGPSEEHLDFLALRYAEDACYCAVVRTAMNNGIVEQMGFNKFMLDGQRGSVSAVIRERLERALEEYVNGPEGCVKITDCYMPWNRTFEVGLTVRHDAEERG
ncbi:DUF4127 family protein [Paenibacillus sp. Aloe-11]|uniref:DUF4127 family protein n=1 Tax=Paenibacillus sp. Aloe-11 TaxID=1050222 RepID=UPI00024EF56B|nr:DUF4127 family protein [Paenibacillus sp. Aloe-11]EHS59771.1 hypothetical protein WG8_0344 [Paenibacillus sp. Aloe-11]